MQQTFQSSFISMVQYRWLLLLFHSFPSQQLPNASMDGRQIPIPHLTMAFLRLNTVKWRT